jgi:hypothetical protein
MSQKRDMGHPIQRKENEKRATRPALALAPEIGPGFSPDITAAEILPALEGAEKSVLLKGTGSPVP